MRPILMTTVSTLARMMPTALELGSGGGTIADRNFGDRWFLYFHPTDAALFPFYSTISIISSSG
ncbi:efflux RND transporter permease subunit [[Phormidium] sp. ETS-05]|uniref:efflux RND transporter permease subunit n=1 Tax=[Phormidium] sp. ETS-05 TaxID=222819 RepID=UPI0018EEF6CC|nr:efflux RND transporter permease subunit [[Phormidium] sp. ETS-05]